MTNIVPSFTESNEGTLLKLLTHNVAFVLTKQKEPAKVLSTFETQVFWRTRKVIIENIHR